MKLGPLVAVVVGGDFPVHAEVEQGLELGFDLSFLALQFGPVLGVLLPAGPGPGPDDLLDPFANFRAGDVQPIEEIEELIVDGPLGQTHSRMTRPVVLRTPVVAVLADRAVRGGLPLLLRRDHMVADGAAHQAARESDFRLADHPPAEPVLRRLEGRPVDEWLERAGMPLPLELDLADVVPVVQDAVQHRLVEAGMPICVDDPLPGEGVDQRHERVRLVGKYLKDAAHLRPVHGVMLDDAATVNADIAVAVLPSHRQAAFNAAADTGTDVGGLLVGLIAGEHRRHATLHPPGGCFTGRLIGEEEGHMRLFGERLQVGPISDVAGSPVNLHEEHSAQHAGVLLDIRRELPEGLALIALRRRLGDLEELDDRAAQSAGELQEAGLLVLQAEALFLLTSRTHPCPRDELLHDSSPVEDSQEPSRADKYLYGIGGRKLRLPVERLPDADGVLDQFRRDPLRRARRQRLVRGFPTLSRLGMEMIRPHG